MKNTEKWKDELVKEVRQDFDARREMRRNIESKWLLNINFMLGNQYAGISPGGDIVDCGKQYFWQQREVYNHIAPIIEARLAKFTRVNCSVNVRPASSSDADINIARLSTKLISSAYLDNNLVGLQSAANYWSELAGTVFYKVMWNTDSGKVLYQTDGKTYREGNIKVNVCPPYEIYPDTLSASGIDGCMSIIHARAYPVDVIKDIWGKEVEGGDVSVINMDAVETGGSYSSKSFRVFSEVKGGHAVVIERYELPTKEYPEGRLIIVAGDELLYQGALPYKNGTNGERGFPFIRQVALEQPASFYGMSLIERLIPVQRAYNAVKNRKQEFINRLSMGVLAVEEGSVDLDNLEEEGLPPGKVVVYRQGATPPHLMNAGSVPNDFRDEEDRLLQKFISISGISNYVNSGSLSAGNISGYALSLLLEQDYSRLSVSTESIRNAVKELSRQILRLFRQFARTERMVKISGDNGNLETAYFLGSELNSDDIVMEADSEMVETPAVRRNMVLDLLKAGLLTDEAGKMNNRNKAKVMEILGFGNWESARSVEDAHIKKAGIENAELKDTKDCGIEEVDDHDIHIAEHTVFLVSGRDNLTDAAKEKINTHIRAHKVLKRLEAETKIDKSTTLREEV